MTWPMYEKIAASWEDIPPRHVSLAVMIRHKPKNRREAAPRRRRPVEGKITRVFDWSQLG